MLSYEVAKSNFSIISQLGDYGQLEGLGISLDDYRILSGSAPWTSSQRNRMTSVLHSMILGSVDLQGLPRFAVPAEYMAAGIAAFVAPINIHAACEYAKNLGEAEEMGRGAPRVKVTADRLFALVSQLYACSERTNAKLTFEKKCGIELGRVLEKQVPSIKLKEGKN